MSFSHIHYGSSPLLVLLSCQAMGLIYCSCLLLPGVAPIHPSPLCWVTARDAAAPAAAPSAKDKTDIGCCCCSWLVHPHSHTHCCALLLQPAPSLQAAHLQTSMHAPLCPHHSAPVYLMLPPRLSSSPRCLLCSWLHLPSASGRLQLH